MKTKVKISIIELFSVLVFLVSSALLTKTIYLYSDDDFDKVEMIKREYKRFSGYDLEGTDMSVWSINEPGNYSLGAIIGVSTCLILMSVLHQSLTNTKSSQS